MPFVMLFTGLAAMVWLAMRARHSQPWKACVWSVVLGYVLGHAFWHLQAGPIPITLDRLVIGFMLVLLVRDWWQGQLAKNPLAAVDWGLAALLAWLTGSALVAGSSPELDLVSSPTSRLLFCFWLPTLVYFVMREASCDERGSVWLLSVMSALGIYLAVTAIAEASQLWWAVFPRYISDPAVGMHFGRARGPALNSVSLGIYLSICFWAAWLLRGRVARHWQLGLLSGLGVMTLAIALTYTRSVYIGLAASGLVVLGLELPQRIRWPVLGGVVLVAGLLLVVAGKLLVSIEREGEAGDSAHSVQQRAAFAYVSYHMVCDYPLWGVGFGRFYDRKMPYLADRRQSFELESIRPLHHHNTVLSYLTETGMVGLGLVLAVTCGWVRWALRLSFASTAPLWARRQGIWAIATVVIYFASALFHDLTLLPAEQTILFAVVGLSTGLAQRFALGSVVTSPAITRPGVRAHASSMA